jgi:hypothetical protein
MKKRRGKEEKEVKITNEPPITVLANSVYYFFHHVLILDEKKRFRLVVIHNDRILFDKHYKTLKGARISFEKKFNIKKLPNKKAEWSPLYDSDTGWLEQMLNGIYALGEIRCC